MAGIPCYQELLELEEHPTYPQQADVDAFFPILAGQRNDQNVPLLPPSKIDSEQFDNNFPYLPNAIKFGPGDAAGNTSTHYTFCIRDTSSCLLSKGSVERSTVSVKLLRADGQPFLELYSSSSGMSRTFTIINGGSQLGVIEVNESDMQTIALTVAWDGLKYKVSSLIKGDIMVSRDQPTSTVISNMHFPVPADSTRTIETGDLTFSENSCPSKIEQCLAIAIGIAFMVVYNESSFKAFAAETVATAAATKKVWFIVIGGLALLGLGLYLIIVLIKWANCRNNPSGKYYTKGGYVHC